MERTRDSLLLALYALPAPPDGMLINRRASAAANERDEGSAESRAPGVDVAASCGRGGGVEGRTSLDAARANRRMDPAGRKRRVTGGATPGDGGAAWDDGGEPQRVPENHRSLDATRKGRGADTAGERFFKKYRSGHDAEEEGGAHGRLLLHRQDRRLEDRGKKHGDGESSSRSVNGAPCSHGLSSTAGERFLNGASCSRGLSSTAGERFLNGAPCSRGLSTTAREHFLGAANRAPCSRGVSTIGRERSVEKHKNRDEHRDPSHDSRHSHHGEPVTHIGYGLEASGRGPLNAGSANATSPDAITKYDPVPELLLCSGEVLSNPWRRIWQHTPLVFHDKSLVRCVVILGGAPSGIVLNLTDQITEILEKHPRDVSYFRLDSTCWTGGRSKLSEWLRILSKKKASEIVIVNREDSTYLEFPLEYMQSSFLRRLRLAFFSLSELAINCFDYSRLDTLELIGCSFETDRLYDVIRDCNNLMNLGIGLTVKNVKISSQSLKNIQLWKCNMQSFSIESAPRLHKMISGIYPVWKKQPVLVMIGDTEGLQEFENLLLPHHKLEDLSWMRSLNKISVGVEMANREQRQLMCNYLEHAPLLQDLQIWRMDEVALLEELDVAIDDSLIKLNAELACFSGLHTFLIDGFRGGAAEVSVISAILKYAMCLIEVKVEPCPTSDKESIVKALLALHSIRRASTNFSVRFDDSS